jgi:hypothetical protein
MDLISTTHELMHISQNHFEAKPSFYNLPNISEIEPKVIELLLTDYLNEKGFEDSEIKKYICCNATIIHVSGRLPRCAKKKGVAP